MKKVRKGMVITAIKNDWATGVQRRYRKGDRFKLGRRWMAGHEPGIDLHSLDNDEPPFGLCSPALEEFFGVTL